MDSAMPTNATDRRRLLAGLALAPALAAAPAVAQAPAEDTELLALGERHAELASRSEELWRLSDAAFARAVDATRPTSGVPGNYRETREAAMVSHGVRALEEQADAVDGVLFEVERKIMDSRATTLAGLRVKANVTACFLGESENGTPLDWAIRSLLADLTA